MESSKKILLTTIGIAVLIVTLVGVTFAFFNYTRTGSSNVIKVGRISFVTRQTETINLTNVFPIDKTTINTDTDNVDEVVIEIEGDTDYSDGIEYLVSSVDSNIYTPSGVLVPISLDVRTSGLGNNNPNYFTARDSKDTTMYKKLVGDTLVGDQMLLVGYIPKNTTSGTAEGVDGSITIKAYFDKDKIKISDTYDGTESDNMGSTNEWAEGKTVITTSEWNALQSSGVSFKVKVEANEGIWVNPSLEEIMKMDNIGIDTDNGVDFSITSDKDGLNGEGTKGVYMRSGTQNDDNPILYYRGYVEDNNVIFANKCWRTVRTTDTGGVKLIYNGEVGNAYEKVALSEDMYDVKKNTSTSSSGSWIFDSSDNSWNTELTSGKAELSFKVSSGDSYIFEIIGQNGTNGGGGYNLYIGETNVAGGGGGNNDNISQNYLIGTLSGDDVVRFEFSGGGYTNPVIFKLRMVSNGNLITNNGCDNIGPKTTISINNENSFEFSGPSMSDSFAYAGYMYGTVYSVSSSGWIEDAKFGSGFTWNGTSYSLTDASVTSPDNNHHYSCNLTDANGTCNELKYVYYISGTKKYYIALTGGEGIEQAIEKMQVNTTSSNAKNKIDTWYSANMTSYTNKLEDTIWCNDRSIDNEESGLQANGGNISKEIAFGSLLRNGTLQAQPILSCPNKNDRFTVNNTNGNQMLNYPVALLTKDENMLAGSGNSYANGSYLKGTAHWTMSPTSLGLSQSVYGLHAIGQMAGLSTSDIRGLRPAISIKPGQPITKGTGTVTDPYVIE